MRSVRDLNIGGLLFCVGCVLIGVDQYNCVYVMRTMNTRDPVTEVSPLYLVNMFEYLLTSGFDFWDVLTAVKSGIAVHFSQLFNFMQCIQHLLCS